MGKLKILNNYNPSLDCVLPDKYNTHGQGWIKATAPKELAKIDTSIKKNGVSYTILEARKFYHSPTELAIRRIFATALCIFTLGTATIFEGVRNFFRNANIVYFAVKTDSINPLMKIDVEGLFPYDKDYDLKLKERAARKANASPFQNMQVEKLTKKSKKEIQKIEERAARKAEAAESAARKAEAEENARKFKEEANSDPFENMEVEELISDLKDVKNIVLSNNSDEASLPLVSGILYGESVDSSVFHQDLNPQNSVKREASAEDYARDFVIENDENQKAT